MNLHFHILEHLKTNAETGISGFGIFSLKNKGAEISNEQSILPPAKEIVFQKDYENRSRAFVTYLSQKENVSEFEAELELKKSTNHWKDKLGSNKEFIIEGIGEFRNAENILVFKGKRIEELAPDFYGLEEIKFSEIKNTDPQINLQEEDTATGDSYQFNRSILWIFLVAVPIAGIIYFSITNREMLFGEKADFTVKNSTKRIKETKIAKDSAKTKAVQDTLKADTLKNHLK